MNRHRTGLVLALVLTVLASVAVRPPQPAADLVQPVYRGEVLPRSTSGPAAERPPSAQESPKLPPRGLPPAAADPFAPVSWYVPPPEPPAAPPPPPSAPALPFTYLGRLEEDGQTLVFLAGSQRHYAVRPGDVLESQWRLEQAQGPRLVFRYLPLDQTRTLEFTP